MQIGAVIRKYRKEKNLTQEALAAYIGVTAPAVNKWESGVSCPDITLLAPIARLLGISTDTLLSFKDDLTRVEIGQIANEIAEKLQTERYDIVFAEAMNIISEYPNCELLILTVTQILDSYRVFGEDVDFEKYADKIIALYKRALQSQDTNTKHGAIIALFNISLEKEEYEKAQDYLNQIEKQQTNPERYQALLYRRQGKTEEAYELYERLISGGYAELSWALNGLYRLAIENNDFQEAEYLTEKQEKLAELLEMGEYNRILPGMCLAQDKKDKEMWFEEAEKLIDSVKEIDAFKKSHFYRHLKFKESANTEMMTQMLRMGFEKDEGIDFLRNDPRFQKIMEKL